MEAGLGMETGTGRGVERGSDMVIIFKVWRWGDNIVLIVGNISKVRWQSKPRNK